MKKMLFILMLLLIPQVFATSITYGNGFNTYTEIIEDNETYYYISQDRYCAVIHQVRYSLSECDFNDYYSYLSQEHSNTIDAIENANIQDNMTVNGNLTVSGYINADDVVVHSDEFRDLSFAQLRTIIENLDNIANGDIDKSKIPEYYKTSDGQGIRMWRILIDVIVNMAKHIYQWHDDVEQRFNIAQQRVSTIEQETCAKYPQAEWSWCSR